MSFDDAFILRGFDNYFPQMMKGEDDVIVEEEGGKKGGIEITDNSKIKYGWGKKSQSIAPKALLKTLQGQSSFYPGAKGLDKYPLDIRTKEDLIKLADTIDKVYELKAGELLGDKTKVTYLTGEINIGNVKLLMEKNNKQNKTKIDVKHLSKMIRDLIETM